MQDVVDRTLEIVGTIASYLEIPFEYLLRVTNVELAPWWRIVWDVFAVAVILLALRWVIIFILDLFRRDRMADKADIDALVGKHASFEQAMQDPAALRATTAFLKKNKQWARLGEAYAAINHHKRAAQYFAKAKEHVKAAEQMAKAEKLPEAAKSLMRAGDFENAGRFYYRGEKFRKSAKAYTKAGKPAKAAAAWGRAGKYAKAIDLFTEYFQAPRDDKKAQIESAHACFELLEDPAGKQKIDPQARRGLLTPIAKCFEAEGKFDRAGALYRESSQLGLAAESYVKSGKLELAAECYKQANMPREAARIGGRFYEKAGKWREAAMAYAGGEEFLRAAECFAKAEEPVRAAEYFSRSKEHARAGLMFARAQRYQEAVDELQKVAEKDKQFDASRALLGRCFYEMHDYAHCAATLENHLLGKRVEKANMDYFYMMALAKEQLGLLAESRDVLYKIGAVEREYRDLDRRISSIDSRISMLGSQAGITPAPAASGGNGGDVAVMSMVQNQLGERYEIEREIGRGGMGVVYLARDKQLDRKVALKFLGSLVDNNEEYRQRFVREAKTAAKINHPNIVAIYDISASQGKAYIAMEYIEGMSLHQYIEKKGKLPAREAINYMAQACAALYSLHSCGIVHRDIKPDNIIIGKGGLIKLMDFGLAKAEDNRITKSNIVMGTPCYMSPEQVQGKDVDARSDIYAMGLVLYEMMTGKCVFRDGDILSRQLTEMPPKLSELVEGVPAGVDELAHKCIAKDREARFENCKVIVEAIRGLSVK
jgi:tetratricopeptide (TPR) repeat protein